MLSHDAEENLKEKVCSQRSANHQRVKNEQAVEPVQGKVLSPGCTEESVL